MRAILSNRNYLKWIIYKVSNSIQAIILTIICSYLLVSVVLLPAPNTNMAIYNVIYDKYTENYYINHFLNTLSIMFKFGKDFKIIPLCPLAVIYIIIIKITILIIFVNYILKELIRRIDAYK